MKNSTWTLIFFFAVLVASIYTKADSEITITRLLTIYVGIMIIKSIEDKK